MTLKYKLGPVTIWLLLSLFWLAFAVSAGIGWGTVVGAPLILAIVLFLVITIQAVRTGKNSREPSIDLEELRRELNPSTLEDPGIREKLDGLLAKYGRYVPLFEIQRLQEFAHSSLDSVEAETTEIHQSGSQG